MAQTYDQKQELLARLIADLSLVLSPERMIDFDSLPEPCRNHLQDRLRKTERGRRVVTGCVRLAVFDPHLFLEGLRLHPHSVCRSTEVLGPVPQALWERIGQELRSHRLWEVAHDLEEASDGELALWNGVEKLEAYRELPQPILDFQEEGRSRSQAPWQDFRGLLQRFLIRARLEKLRFHTYSALKNQAKS